MIGTTLLHYQITAPLGEGGNAHVYLATDTRTGDRVALKLVTQGLRRDPRALERVQREARASAMLDHEGIVRLHALEQAEGQTFLVHEYIEGETLAVRVQRGPLPPEHALQMAETLASALAHAHERGVEHRDLKPSNVMVATDHTCKLLDFGIVRLAGDVTITDSGIVLGSLPYLAPERIRGERGDTRSDLFGFGMVCYTAISARHPFTGKNDAAMLSAIMLSPPAPLEGLSDALVALGELTMQLLEKAPEKRPATAADVLQRIRRMRGSL